MTNSICQVCNINKVTMIGATTCSLKCACDVVGDDFYLIRARVAIEVHRMMAPCKPRSRTKA